MSSPLVSVITPSYNSEAFIQENILSIKRQDVSDLEHIVVDGRSTDNTINILKEHECDYNLRWVSEEDGGQTDAVNKGISMANGEYIIWLNSDDYLTVGALEEFSKIVARNRFDVVYGDLEFVTKECETIDVKRNTRASRFINRYLGPFTANHCTFIRSNVFNSVGSLNPNHHLAMDMELFWKLLNANLHMKHVPSIWAAHRVHTEAKTSKHREAQIQESKQITNAMYHEGFIESQIPEPLLVKFTTALRIYYLISEGSLDIVLNRISRRLRND